MTTTTGPHYDTIWLPGRGWAVRHRNPADPRDNYTLKESYRSQELAEAKARTMNLQGYMAPDELEDRLEDLLDEAVHEATECSERLSGIACEIIGIGKLDEAEELAKLAKTLATFQLRRQVPRDDNPSYDWPGG